MLASAVRFADDAAGIEKSLRLLQGFSTAAAGLAQSAEEAAPWAQARSQLALGRRYFRVLRWYPCWTTAYRAFNNSKNAAPLLVMLEVAKWCFLGFYYFLEMPTITNTMGSTNYDWGHVLQLEANKCWVYAIVFSILESMYHLFQSESSVPVQPTEKRDEDEKTIKDPEPVNKPVPVRLNHNIRPAIFRQLLIDSCDLVIAASSVGWLAASEVQVGTAYVISSTVAGQALWNKVQAAAG